MSYLERQLFISRMEKFTLLVMIIMLVYGHVRLERKGFHGLPVQLLINYLHCMTVGLLLGLQTNLAVRKEITLDF